MRRQLALPLILALAALAVTAFFGEVLFGGAVYYPGDIARIYLPQRIALQAALHAGKLPWWSSTLGAGYPLLAQGELGALYPPNWLLYALLPVEIALNVSIMLHYLLSGLGLYLLARQLRLSRPAALFGALAWALGGVNIAHLSHISILSTLAWLPWLLVLTHRLLTSPHPPWRNSLTLGLVVGLQFLAGHPQMAVLNLLAVGMLVVALGWRERMHLERRAWFAWLAAMLLGLLLGLPQLLPAYQLGALSQRAGGLEGEFFTSYSFHPFLLATFVSPFALGNPYPQGSVELMGYTGLLPLGLAGVAVWRSPRRARWFLLALAGLGVLLSFGRWNPLYRYLNLVPVLNLFRVPARYLCWTSLALALLAALGLDVLYKAPDVPKRERSLVGVLGVGAALAAIIITVLATGAAADPLVRAWRWLPLVLAAVTVAIIGAMRHAKRSVLALLACATLLVDLYAYGAVLDRTYNATLPLASVRQEPLSVGILRQDAGLYRIYTKEEIVPALAPLRESLYPNIAQGYGLASANLYLPLVPSAYGDYVTQIDAARLNLLNVKYYLIPQLLPVDEASELYDVANPFADLPANRWLAIPETTVASLSIESYLSHAADLPDGALAAELVLRDASGMETIIPLRAGIETAEWAFERSDVAKVVAHSLAALASTWPARSGYPPEDHVGHTYQALVQFDPPLHVQAVLLRPALPEAFVRIERVRLRDTQGEEQLLSHLLGLGNHSIVYRSEDVLIYRNEDALPRAFALPAAQVTRSANDLQLPTELRSTDVLPVEVVRYDDQRVHLQLHAADPAYLILTDLAYPGWRGAVDGRDAPLLTVGGVFRAVELAAGAHEVVFTFHPLASLINHRGQQP